MKQAKTLRVGKHMLTLLNETEQGNASGGRPRPTSPTPPNCTRLPSGALACRNPAPHQ